MLETIKYGWTVWHAIISAVIVVVYYKLHRFLKSAFTVNDLETRRIIRALTLIVTVYLCGWATTITLLGLSIILISDTNLSQATELGLGLFAGVNVAIPCAVYYSQSNIYRNEIRRMLQLKTTVMPVKIIPLAGGNCTSVLMLLIGIDRYLSVVHPGWYFSFHIIICSIYCVSVNVAQYMAQTYEPSVICFLPSAMPDRIKDWWSASQGFLSVMVIAVYVRMHRFLKSRPTQCDVEARRTIRALTMIVKVYLFGWATSIGLLCFSRILISDTNLAQAAELGLGVFAGLNLAIPCAVYYTQSNIYRKELRSLLRLKIEVSDIRTVSRHTS
ncbi:hypothetical protein QR680_014750 [Steinernema hermaphroditum]|uniref:G-protein coupled receptors family 1 profile domain-containing protein n=1 Tax=Steinernema hermaphroditum TaxID=289476 RepID=A0AA39IA06_9BILA|nr:hypothetical protein QR680_014750 [Steinernema hermaphroditum]